MIEDGRTEFKREYTADLRRTVVAFANCEGGSIYIGIENDGNVVGLSNPDEVMLKISSNIRDSITPDVSLISNIDTICIDGKYVVRVDIMKGVAGPYYLTSKGPRPDGVFIRSGSATIPANAMTIIELIKAASGFSYEEELSVVQELSFDYTKKVFSECGVDFNEAALRNFGAVNENNQYTNLALLLSDQCPHIIKLATFQGRDKRVFRDRLVAEGSVFEQINTATEYVKKYNRIRAEIVEFHRDDSYDYQMDTVREMLYNAVIHRDYSYDSPIIVSIMDDRIETVNIGGLYGNLSASELGSGISACRNKRLAEVFYRLRLVEAFGTGIMRINSAYHNCSRQPEFRPGQNSFLAVLPNMNTEREELYDFRLREEYELNSYGMTQRSSSVAMGTAGLTEREQAALKLAKASGSIVRADLENALGISQATAILLLRDMTGRGLLQKSGAGKNTRYIIHES